MLPCLSGFVAYSLKMLPEPSFRHLCLRSDAFPHPCIPTRLRFILPHPLPFVPNRFLPRRRLLVSTPNSIVSSSGTSFQVSNSTRHESASNDNEWALRFLRRYIGGGGNAQGGEAHGGMPA